MLIGTDNFSNCKACGKKVPIRLRSCPHCREPDPQLRNWLGWRVNYTKALDPSVSSKWKSIWPFRIRIGKRLAIPSLIALIVAALALDYFTPDLIIKFSGLPDGPTRSWLGVLYVALLILLPICVVAALSRED